MPEEVETSEEKEVVQKAEVAGAEEADQETEMLVEEVVEDINSAQEEETQLTPEVENAITVVRDGYLTDRAEILTVGDILETYSEEPGYWDGFTDEDGDIFVYYGGMRDNEYFALEFQVYEDDTFLLTGAAKGEDVIEEYADFFQEILNVVGI